MLISHTLRGSLLSFVLFCCGFSGCGGYSVTGGPAPLVKPPLDVQSSTDFSKMATQNVFVAPIDSVYALDLGPEVKNSLTNSLATAFQANTSADIVNFKAPASTGALAASPAAEIGSLQQFDAGRLKTRALQAATKASAGAVLYGVVSSCTDAVNNGTPSEGPANVSFHLWMLQVPSGKPLWEAAYGKRDEVLTENVFRFQQALKGSMTRFDCVQRAQDGFVLAAKQFEAQRAAADGSAPKRP